MAWAMKVYVLEYSSCVPTPTSHPFFIIILSLTPPTREITERYKNFHLKLSKLAKQKCFLMILIWEEIQDNNN